MKKRLRLLAWLITLTILCQMLPFSAFAQSDIAQTLVQRRVSASSLDEQNDLSSVTFEGGTGTPEDPYQIATAEQLDAIRNNLSASYILLNYIDLSSYGNWIPIGDSSSSGFTGTLDGNGHSIQNMTITSSGLDYSAFIGSALNATVKNLSLTNVDIEVSDTHCVAGIIGSAVDNCIIESCSVSGNIRVTTARVELLIGGIVGSFANTSDNSGYYPSISNSVNRAAITVDGPDFTTLLSCGGIVGSSDASIVDCENYGEINSISRSSIFTGGIVGDCSANVTSCKNFGTVFGQSNNETYTVAGIAGRAPTVSYCVNSGSVHGHSGFKSGGNATGITGMLSSLARFCFNIATNIDSTYGDDSAASIAYRVGGAKVRNNCYSLNTTLVNGVVPAESIGTAQANGESLSYDEILAKIREYFPDFELEPDVPDEPSKEFTFKRDNLSFLNAPQYFFLGDELNYWKYAYNNPNRKRENYPKSLQTLPEDSGRLHLSDDKMEKVTRNLSESAHRWIANRIKYTWTGSCYGMVAISLIHYLEPDRLPYSRLSVSGVDDNSLTYQLPSPIESHEIEDFVNYYMMQQFLPTYYKTWSNYSYNCEHNFEGTLNEILNSLYKHHPVFVSMSNHQILFLEVLETYSDHYVIGIYDPNEAEEQRLTLYKDAYAVDDDPKIHISYGENNYIRNYILSDDLDLIDVRNYFDITPDHETQTDYTDGHIIIDADNDVGFIFGHQYYYRTENGKLCEKNSNVKILKSSNALNEDSSNNLIELVFPKPSSSEDAVLELTSSGVNDASMLLNDTMLSVSTDGPTRLTYNEQARTIDVTSSTPTGVSLLLTQNNPSEAWPWDTFAVDVPQSTTLHIELTGDSLKISGDYLSGATYATENMTDDVVSGGDIPDGMDNVTIVNKNGSNGNTTDIKTPDPVEPAELTVSVSGGTIIQINDDAFAESLTTHTAKQGDKITIMANTTDKFNGWTVNEGDVELDDATAPTTTFTMGEKSVEITAEYKDDSTEPVEPAELTVSVSGGTIIQINDDAFAESLTTHTAKQGDKITIMADTTDKFNGWIVNEGDVTLDDATAPTTTFTMNEKSVRITAEYQNSSTDPTPTPTPGGNSSSGSGGGGGGGAAVLIGVGAAAAITAGVFMMSPVEIKGRVVLADQAAVPGAKISLLREGKVVAQTTADENGNFSLKAKRGSYELTAAYTNADGQLIYKTINIKAPAKDLTMTF